MLAATGTLLAGGATGGLATYSLTDSARGATAELTVTGDEAAPDSARTAWWGRCGRTIEANTTPGPASTAAERDGGGVWRRVRCIRPHSYFRIVGFVSPTC